MWYIQDESDLILHANEGDKKADSNPVPSLTISELHWKNEKYVK